MENEDKFYQYYQFDDIPSPNYGLYDENEQESTREYTDSINDLLSVGDDSQNNEDFGINFNQENIGTGGNTDLSPESSPRRTVNRQQESNKLEISKYKAHVINLFKKFCKEFVAVDKGKPPKEFFVHHLQQMLAEYEHAEAFELSDNDRKGKVILRKLMEAIHDMEESDIPVLDSPNILPPPPIETLQVIRNRAENLSQRPTSNTDYFRGISNFADTVTPKAPYPNSEPVLPVINYPVIPPAEMMKQELKKMKRRIKRKEKRKRGRKKKVESEVIHEFTKNETDLTGEKRMRSDDVENSLLNLQTSITNYEPPNKKIKMDCLRTGIGCIKKFDPVEFMKASEITPIMRNNMNIPKTNYSNEEVIDEIEFLKENSSNPFFDFNYPY